MSDSMSAAMRDPAAYARQQRMAQARALMQQGMDTSPIQSHTQGLARLAQALLGGYMQYRTGQEIENVTAKQDERRQALVSQLMGGGQSAPEQPAQAPQTPPAAPQAPVAMPDVAPRGEAPAAVSQGIAARASLDPNAPDYPEQIMAINNRVVGQTMPNMRPQPVPQVPVAPPPQTAPSGAPPLNERALMAMVLSGDPQTAQMAQGLTPFIARRERNEDQAVEREWRRQEADRAQRNADRSFGLQASQLSLAQQAAARAEDAARRGQIPQGYMMDRSGQLVRMPGYEPPQGSPSASERDRARYISLDARRGQLSPEEQVELAYLERAQTIPQVAAGPNGVAIVERPPLPSQAGLAPPAAPVDGSASAPASPAPGSSAQTVPVPGGGRASFVAGQGNLTEAQAKANMFGNAMENADRGLATVQVPSTPMQFAWRNLPEGLVNPAMPENDQRYFNYLRSFAAGILRKETGAAFTTPELLDVQSRFFPLPGDSPAVIEQKAEARRQAIESMRAEIPGGFRGQVPQAGVPIGQTGATAEPPRRIDPPPGFVRVR